LSSYTDDLSPTVNSIRDLAATVRGRRLDLRLSQAELAGRARVSRQWISEFEAGKPTAELGLVIRLLEALELRLSLDAHPGDELGTRPPAGATVDLDDMLDEYLGH
jgi:HTH-type transcriptional regulator/antitoxin HipB